MMRQVAWLWHLLLDSCMEWLSFVVIVQPCSASDEGALYNLTITGRKPAADEPPAQEEQAK